MRDYLISVVLGFVACVALTMIWSGFKGRATVFAWFLGGILGAVAWWVAVTFSGGLQAFLTIALVGVFMFVIDWHQKLAAKEPPK